MRFYASLAVIVLGFGFIGTAWVVGPRDRDERTAWDTVMSQIGKDGTVGLEMAKQAFVLAYAPLPGVQRPEGDFGPPRSTSDVVSWILSHWDALTGEEQRIVADALGLSLDDKVINGMRLAASGNPRLDGTCTKRQGVELRDPTDEFVVPVPGAKAELERLTGVKFDATVTVCLTDQTRDEEGQTVLADTLSQHLPDGSYRCRVTIFKGGQNYQDIPRLAIFVHELTHCLFRRIAEARKDANGFVNIPPWIDEGLNQWVTLQLVGSTPDLEKTLAGWIGDPRKPVFERSYDALGFFGHSEQVSGGLAARVKEIVGVAGDNYSLAAYQKTMGDAAEEFLGRYASSFAEDLNRGKEWRLSVPGLAYYQHNAPTYVLKNDSDPVTAGALPFGAGLTKIVFEADVVMLVPSLGTGHAWGRFGPDPGLDFNLLDASRFVFCAKDGGCACPDGYKPDLDFTEIGATGWLAITGADKEAYVGAVGYSLEHFCKKKPKPVPIPGGPWGDGGGAPPGGGPPGGGGQTCSGTCGGATTDPHLNTYDGLFYDLQSVGEYTLTASAEGDVEVQSRTAPDRKSVV